MSQTLLITTSTAIDINKLNMLLSYAYFKEGSFDGINKLNERIQNPDFLKEIEDNFSSLLNQGLVVVPSFTKKEEFREQLLGFFQHYNQPSLLFLGNLSDYSVQLQEGMLKLLEEPPKNLTPVLYTNSTNIVLETIKSRSKNLLLSKQLVFNILNQTLLESVKKKLPPAQDYLKLLVSGQTSGYDIDLKEVERDELGFWLWQLHVYAEMYFSKSPSASFSELIDKIAQARNLNNQNLLKKLVLARLF